MPARNPIIVARDAAIGTATKVSDTKKSIQEFYNTRPRTPEGFEVKGESVRGIIFGLIFAGLAAFFQGLVPFSDQILYLIWGILPPWLAGFVNADYISGAFIAFSAYFAGKSKAKAEDLKKIEK